MDNQQLLDLSRRLSPEELQRFLASQNQPIPINTGAGLQNPITPSYVNLPNTRPMPAPDTSPNVTQIPIDTTETRLRRLLYAPPQQSDYEPSTGRKIGAGIAGFFTGLRDPRLGMEVSSNIRSAPYDTAYQDWLAKTKALQEQSTNELNTTKANYAGLGDLARYRLTTPEVTGQIAESKVPAEIATRAPGIAARTSDINATNESRAQIADQNRQAENTRQAGNEAGRNTRFNELQNREDARQSALLKARTKNLGDTLGIRMSELELHKSIFNLQRVKAVRGAQQANMQAEQEALKLLAQRPEYADIITTDKRGKLGVSAYNMQQQKNMGIFRKYSDKDIPSKIEKLNEEKNALMDGLLKTADEYGDIQMPPEIQ